MVRRDEQVFLYSCYTARFFEIVRGGTLISARRRKLLDSHSRAYVVGNGRRTGNEYLVGYCLRSGKVLGRHTSNHPSKVAIPNSMVTRLSDKRGRGVIHHNHPGGSSLSSGDLRNLAHLPGTLFKYAHGHSGEWYRAETLRKRDFARLLEAGYMKFAKVRVEPGMMKSIPNEFVNHILNLGYDRAKLIRYTYELSREQKLRYNLVPSADIEVLINAVVIGVAQKGA
ncbi:hypothetical protein LO55_1272 [Massilia timonae]|uniref:Uncharacterized protein n=2 Tax=Massilia timonae TaxID=47229 RepID=A0A1S2N5T2_9BURK|nr:hypothetical protein LO55_1272 [Massilia timonae]